MDILAVNVPRKMKETEIVECNGNEKNIGTGFIKSIEEKRHIR
jgi:hypothetical protein